MFRHSWDLSPSEAMQLQREARDRVIIRALDHPPRTVAGLDVHGDRGAVAVFSFPDLSWVTGAIAEHAPSFPYIPGLLSFREMPAMLAAAEKLGFLPDLFMCDGHGLAHPRRFGIACHWGLWTERPTIGCAKSRLRGHYDEPGPERGATASLTERGQVIGTVLRTRTNVKPVYVSIGHLITLQDAVHIVLACASRYRLPEPLRVAHGMAQKGRLP